jgi:hypothetical protein
MWSLMYQYQRLKMQQKGQGNLNRFEMIITCQWRACEIILLSLYNHLKNSSYAICRFKSILVHWVLLGMKTPILTVTRWNHNIVLICIFLMTEGVEHFSHVCIGHLLFIIWKGSVHLPTYWLGFLFCSCYVK